MKQTLIGIIALACAMASHAGQNYHYLCTLDGRERVVEVAYLLAEQNVPCEVRYQKNDSDTEVLWRADNKEGFCERKARQFVEKQRQWGFSCEGVELPKTIRQNSRY